MKNNVEHTEGIHVGIVIQNNDPEKRARVKVFIPHLSPALNTLFNENDKFFTVPGISENTDEISKTYEELKKYLPWAEYAGPIFGGSSTGRYNATLGVSTTNDSSEITKNDLEDDITQGFRPCNLYVDKLTLNDDFNQIDEHHKTLNPYSFEYKPSNYSGLARGMFSIPNVGSHVYVFFMGGERNKPVYFASAYSSDDVKRIYSLYNDPNKQTTPDYPATFENKKLQDETEDSKTFRSKTVFNTNKHTLEFVDTDKLERVKLTHYSGSFLSFTNDCTSFLSTSSNQSLILGDNFKTVKKSNSVSVGKNNELIIKGNSYKVVGETDKQILEALKLIHKDIHEYKLLFDLKRVDFASDKYQELSSFQSKEGESSDCPVCQGAGNIGRFECSCCEGKRKSPSTYQGLWVSEPLKLSEGEMDSYILSRQSEIFNLEKLLNKGGDEHIKIAMSKVENIGLVVNDLKSFKIDSTGILTTNKLTVSDILVYPSKNPTPLVEKVDVVNLPGGDYNLTVGNKWKVLVGSNGIDIKTYGCFDIYGTIMTLLSEQMNICSKTDVSISSNDKLSLSSKNISLNSVDRSPIFINAPAHIDGNMIVNGGAHFDGEVGLFHITSPTQIRDTETVLDTQYSGAMTPTLKVGYTSNPTTGTVGAHQHDIYLNVTHYHNFKTIPCKLVDSVEATRETMAEVNVNTNLKSEAYGVEVKF